MDRGLPGLVHSATACAARTCELREHERDELAHYAKRTVDIEYEFPIGWSELMGIANRTDFDLKQHAKWSGKSLTYFDEERKEHVVPYVDRAVGRRGPQRCWPSWLDAYREEEVRGEKRVVLRLPSGAGADQGRRACRSSRSAPRSFATAHAIRADARHGSGVTVYDDTAAIGRLYRRQDEVGTPYCVTVDVQTVGRYRARARRATSA